MNIVMTGLLYFRTSGLLHFISAGYSVVADLVSATVRRY